MDKFLSISNRLYEIIVGNLTILECWGFYLFSPDFDKEIELRNKLGVIFICSLLDTLEAEMRFLPEIEKEASELGFSSLEHNAKQLQNFCVIVGELLQHYTREEQIFMNDIRNQWVHSYFVNRHRESLNVKYVINGKIVKENIPQMDYAALLRIFYENGKSLDETLQILTERTLKKKLRYLEAISKFQKDKDIIYQAIRSGEKIKISI